MSGYRLDSIVRMGLSVGGMTSILRRHYVLAKDYLAAKPYIQELRNIGFRDSFYLETYTPIKERDPEELAFIFIPGWELLPNSGSLWYVAAMKIKQGAIVKSPPQLPNSAGMTVGDYQNILGKAVGDMLASPIDATTFPSNFPKIAAPAPEPETEYSQVFLGGAYNGLKVSRILGMHADVISLTEANSTEQYKLHELTVIGRKLGFWVSTNVWPERSKLVADYLLSGLQSDLVAS